MTFSFRNTQREESKNGDEYEEQDSSDYKLSDVEDF